MTFEELLDHLKREDEMTILEMLDISSNELVDILADKLLDNIEKLREYYDCESDEATHG